MDKKLERGAIVVACVTVGSFKKGELFRVISYNGRELLVSKMHKYFGDSQERVEIVSPDCVRLHEWQIGDYVSCKAIKTITGKELFTIKDFVRMGSCGNLGVVVSTSIGDAFATLDCISKPTEKEIEAQRKEVEKALAEMEKENTDEVVADLTESSKTAVDSMTPTTPPTQKAEEEYIKALCKEIYEDVVKSIKKSGEKGTFIVVEKGEYTRVVSVGFDKEYATDYCNLVGSYIEDFTNYRPSERYVLEQ